MLSSTLLRFAVAFLLIIFTAASLRLLYVLPVSRRGQPVRRRKRNSKDPAHLMVVLGSGGHTAEMLSMLSVPSFRTHSRIQRTYVVSEGDDFSARKAAEFEQNMRARSKHDPELREEEQLDYAIHTVPRARKIHQSLFTTPLSCLRCLLASISLLWTHPFGKPDLILVNGPATALIIILAGLVLEFFSFLTGWDRGKGRSRSIYVESWARVRTPSLSCRLIVTFGLCDQVFVQWLQLEKAGWGTYRGVLVQ